MIQPSSFRKTTKIGSLNSIPLKTGLNLQSKTRVTYFKNKNKFKKKGSKAFQALWSARIRDSDTITS